MTNSTHSTSRTRNILKDEESQVCFVAALGCGLLGLLGVALESLVALATPLSAFLMAGLLYLIAGMMRVLQMYGETRQEMQLQKQDRQITPRVVRKAA